MIKMNLAFYFPNKLTRYSGIKQLYTNASKEHFTNFVTTAMMKCNGNILL